jgi:hypothetical protein
LDVVDDKVVSNWGTDIESVPADLSCVLDIADAGGASDKVIAQILGVTEKAAHTECELALRKLRYYSISDQLSVFR